MLILWLLCGQNVANAQTPPAPVVKISAPKMQKIVELDEYTGRFEATKRVDIRSRINGYLQEIRFKDGQMVNKGQILFIIDQRPLKIALTRAQSRYDLASKELARAKGLRNGNVISQQALERVNNIYITDKSALEDAQLELDFSEIKAPINGRVSRHKVDVGNLISGGNENATLLTTIIAENPIHFYFEASEQDLLKYIRLSKQNNAHNNASSNFRDGAKNVQVKLQDETEFSHDGNMDFVDNEIDKATGSIQGRAIFANKDATLVAGMFGRMRIAASDEYEAMLIPDEAIATNQNQKIVFIVNETNIVESRPVQLGGLHEDATLSQEKTQENSSQQKTIMQKWRIVKSGLHPNDKIIWQGLAKVRAGMAVTIEDITSQNNTSTNATPKTDAGKS